jgi:glyceraldehyde-3-phosphate dehydrogenase/erythrose-4-phosphate dehydrogenase
MGSAASAATSARHRRVGRKDIEVVAVNDLGPVETNAHLLRYDSRARPLPA